MKYLVILCMSVSVAYAHQPVMDMAPRWADGYGFQIRQEHYGSDQLRRGNSRVPNGLGIEREVDTTWLEGVYTFHRSVRVTVKIPYVEQTRDNAAGVRQQSSGMGDVIIGLPLKRYKNKGAMTENWSFTPSVRVPTGTSSGDFPISDGSWDLGASFSYSRESPRVYQLYDLYYWHQGSGERGMQTGDSWGLDVNVGLHPWHNNDQNSGVFTLWDISVLHNQDANALNLTTASGSDRVQTGPVFIYYRQNLMVRAEFKFLAYEHVDGISPSRGNEFSLGLGFTF